MIQATDCVRDADAKLRFTWIRRALNFIRVVDDVAAPASTLLWWSLAGLLLVTAVRGASATPVEGAPEPVRVEGVATPGGQLSVSVAASPDRRLQAYLPGLDHRRVELRFDPRSGRHVGTVAVPAHAPTRGYFTLRAVGDGELDREVQVPDGSLAQLSSMR